MFGLRMQSNAIKSNTIYKIELSSIFIFNFVLSSVGAGKILITSYCYQPVSSNQWSRIEIKVIGSDETVRAGFVVLPIHCIAYTLLQ